MLASATSLVTAFSLWQAESNRIVDQVEFAALDAADSSDPVGSIRNVAGADTFVVVFDSNASIVAQSESQPDQLTEVLIDDIWSVTSSTEEPTTLVYPGLDGEPELSVSGISCVDESVCDTVVVGSYQRSFWQYSFSNALNLFGSVLLVTALAGMGARWLVARSLRPVDLMRQELSAITAANLESRILVPDSGDELSDLGRTFNQTISRLDSAVAANESFVADAAHELRSPIAGVRAAVELEASKSPGGILDDAVVELDRAGRLVDDLLVLARGAGSSRAPMVDVDLDDLVLAEIRLARSRFESIEIAATVEPARTVGHPDPLRRLVSNLIENACLYGNSRVHVVLQSGDSSPRLIIHDDGPGIAPTDVERIFERFARLDASRSRSTGGSGLGLAIVSEIVTDHGATIEVQRSELGGASFLVSFRQQRTS